ncbi:MAG TPA: YcnI family protein [Nakamurella sp.]
MSKSFLRACGRTVVVAAGVAVLSLTGALAASAHVTVSADTTAAGSDAVLTFSVPHGCDGSATTKIAIKVPDQVTSVTPTVNPNWDVQKVTEALNPPITDSDGNQITQRVDQVVYTAKTPLAADLRDALALSLQVPDVAGQSLTFPVIQTCEVGETAWIEQQAAGQPEPAHPAPTIQVTAAMTESAAEGSAAPTSSAQVAATAATDTGSSSNGLAIAGLVAGVLGLIVGGLALVRSRRP